MELILQSPVSVVHITAALTALASGTWVLFRPKGTPGHRVIGYVYVSAMTIVLTTAFGIYRLFGHFGIVHWGAVASALSLVAGIVPITQKSRVHNWLLWHYIGMGCSVTGLYATLIVEATYRLFPPAYFWWTTVGTANVVFVIGAYLLWSHRRKWFQPAKRPRRRPRTHTATGALMAGQGL